MGISVEKKSMFDLNPVESHARLKRLNLERLHAELANVLSDEMQAYIMDKLGPSIIKQLLIVKPDFFNQDFILLEWTKVPKEISKLNGPVDKVEPKIVFTTNEDIFKLGEVLLLEENFAVVLKQNCNIILAHSDIMSHRSNSNSDDDLIVSSLQNDPDNGFGDQKIIYNNGGRGFGMVWGLFNPEMITRNLRNTTTFIFLYEKSEQNLAVKYHDEYSMNQVIFDVETGELLPDALRYSELVEITKGSDSVYVDMTKEKCDIVDAVCSAIEYNGFQSDAVCIFNHENSSQLAAG